MIDDLELVVAAPAAAVEARVGGVAWAVAALVAAIVIAVDPAGLVPTGPLRFTAIAVSTGLALGALVRRPFAIPRAISAVWLALVGVLLLATFNAEDPLHAWIGTPDRRLGLLTWLTFPALLFVGHACNTRNATRVPEPLRTVRRDDAAMDHDPGRTRNRAAPGATS